MYFFTVYYIFFAMYTGYIRKQLPVAAPVAGCADCRNDFSNTL